MLKICKECARPGVRHSVGLFEQNCNLFGKININFNMLPCSSNVNIFERAAAFSDFAAFLAAFAISMTDTGLCFPFVRRELNSPSVENP